MNDASVALATSSTDAVRNPAKTNGTASGHSTRRRIWRAVIPIPRAASSAAGDAERSPSSVLITIGGIPSATSAKSAGRKPKPRYGNARVSTAMLGTTRSAPAPNSVSPRATGRPAAKPATGTPMTTAAASAESESPICVPR
jgi:hypothetical protein